MTAMFQVLLAGGASWQTAFSQTLAVETTQSFNTETIRIQIAQGELTTTGGSQVRLTLVPHTSSTYTITSMYIGQSAASYSSAAPSFASTPTQILVGGSGSFTLPGGGANVVTDAVNFSIPSSQGITISIHFNNGSNINLTAATTGTSTTGSYVAGDSASTVTVSGYTAFTAGLKRAIVTKVETLK